MASRRAECRPKKKPIEKLTAAQAKRNMTRSGDRKRVFIAPSPAQTTPELWVVIRW
jgi:hypothetical protein